MRTNEEELDLFADLIEPFGEILADKEVSEAFQRGKAATAIKVAIKKHPKEVIEILARIDDTPVEEYKVSAVTIPVKLLALLNRPEVKDLFTSADQSNAAGRFGSATENIGDGVQ